MNDDQSKKRRTKSLIKEKSFYAALFGCLAVTCAAGWAVITSSRGGSTGLSVKNDILTSRSDELLSGNEFFVFSEEPEYSPVISDSVNEDELIPADTNLSAEPEAAVMEPAEPEPPKEPETHEAPVFETLELDERLPALFVWPLGGSVDTPFSVNALIYDITMNDWRTHDGIDISAAAGAKVSASADGTVKEIYNDDMYGTTVVISHSGGMESIYSNLAAVPAVSAGDRVEAGDVIGSVGATSLAESGMGSHLHLAFLLNGAPMDPRDYLTGR